MEITRKVASYDIRCRDLSDKVRAESALNVSRYYALIYELTRLIRNGWSKKFWNVSKERLESVAEHVFKTLNLAIVIQSEFGYAVRIYEVLMMLALHETEEAIIGDMTPYSAGYDEKLERGHAAVLSIFSTLKYHDELYNLILEFDARMSPEAKFAYMIDKLDACLQAKIYDEEHCVDMSPEAQKDNPALKDPRVKELFDSGLSFGELWIVNEIENQPFDENFITILDYARKHSLTNLGRAARTGIQAVNSAKFRTP